MAVFIYGIIKLVVIAGRGISVADNRISSNVNRNVLEQILGFKRLSNTSVFTKGDIFILSPSVQNDHSWFDLRRVNINRYNEKKYYGYLLIRYFNKFLIAELDSFIKVMIPENQFVYTKSIGEHWKFNVIQTDNGFTIVNRQDRKLTYTISEATIDDLSKKLG